MECVPGEEETQGTPGQIPLTERAADLGPQGVKTMPRIIRMVCAVVIKLKTSIGGENADGCTVPPARGEAFCEFTTVHFQGRNE